MIFEVPGPPIAWARAARRGNRYYDKQLAIKTQFAWNIRSQMKDTWLSARLPAKIQVILTIEFRIGLPKSLSKKAALPLQLTPHTKTPDLSNLIKFVEDALTGILWIDDKIIYEIHARKTNVFPEEAATVFFMDVTERNFVSTTFI